MSYSRSQMEQQNCLEESGIRRTTPTRDQLARSEDLSGDHQGSSDKSQSMDEAKDDAEARSDSSSIEGDFIYRRHVEPRVQLYVPKEETFLIPLTYIDVTRATQTNVLQESRIDDYWEVDVARSLSDSWTGFTKFAILNEKHQKRIFVVPGGGLQKIKQLPDGLACE